MKNVGKGQMRNRNLFRFSTLAFAIQTVCIGGLTLPLQQAYAETVGTLQTKRKIHIRKGLNKA